MSATASAILLTGFGPFPGVAENATAKLVPALADLARAEFPQHEVRVEIFETAWGVAPHRAAALIAQHRPALALHFGVAREARGFQIERIARNVCRIANDVTGCGPSSAVLAHEGPDIRSAAIDADALAAHLTRLGYPVSLSDDAGAYLCNAVLYHSLGAAQALAQIEGTACRSGFIHIPADLDGPPLSFAQALEGSLEILRNCLRY